MAQVKKLSHLLDPGVCAASTLIIAEHEYQPFTGHSSDHLRHGQVQVRACHCNLAKIIRWDFQLGSTTKSPRALATKYYPFGTLTWKNAHL